MKISVWQLTKLIREAVQERSLRETLEQANPYVHVWKHADGQSITVGFRVQRRSEPLWWTESGFKDLSRVKLHPQEFATKADAEEFIKNDAIPFIKRWRPDDVVEIRS
jgi:predicted metallo-beta-lactamase superfamily hydrolase